MEKTIAAIEHDLTVIQNEANPFAKAKLAEKVLIGMFFVVKRQQQEINKLKGADHHGS